MLVHRSTGTLSILLSADVSIRKRIDSLLANPYAGARSWEKESPAARYSSNCHGTTLYVLGLRGDESDGSSRPGLVGWLEIGCALDASFVHSDGERIYDVAAFYTPIGEIAHTAIVLSDGEIFHQAGTGGIFERKKLDDVIHTYLKEDIPDVRFFRRKT